MRQHLKWMRFIVIPEIAQMPILIYGTMGTCCLLVGMDKDNGNLMWMSLIFILPVVAVLSVIVLRAFTSTSVVSRAWSISKVATKREDSKEVLTTVVRQR